MGLVLLLIKQESSTTPGEPYKWGQPEASLTIRSQGTHSPSLLGLKHPPSSRDTTQMGGTRKGNMPKQEDIVTSWIRFPGNNGKEGQKEEKSNFSESMCFAFRYSQGLSGLHQVRADRSQGLERPLKYTDTDSP